MNLKEPNSGETVSSSLERPQHISGDWQTINKYVLPSLKMYLYFQARNLTLFVAVRYESISGPLQVWELLLWVGLQTLVCLQS